MEIYAITAKDQSISINYFLLKKNNFAPPKDLAILNLLGKPEACRRGCRRLYSPTTLFYTSPKTTLFYTFPKTAKKSGGFKILMSETLITIGIFI